MSKSPNYSSRKGWTPDMICMHVCEGTYKGSINWLCNPDNEVSSHYVSGKNGELIQLVDLDKAAWCNGTSVIKDAKYDYRRSTNRLVKERKTNANYYTISIENEGYSYKDGYGKLTEKQYETVLELCKNLITKYPKILIDREHIVGHYEIAPKEKPNCPGTKFQWKKLINDLEVWKKGYPFKIGETIYPKEDIILLSTAGYSNSNKGTIKKGTKCIVAKYHTNNGLYMAIYNEKKEYFSPATWSNEYSKFTKEEVLSDKEIQNEEPILKPDIVIGQETEEQSIEETVINSFNDAKKSIWKIIWEFLKKIIKIIK